jgi:hypothetical protein
MSEEIIQGWKVGSVYLTDLDVEVQIMQINESCLTIRGPQELYFAYDLNEIPEENCSWGKIQHLLSGNIQYANNS